MSKATVRCPKCGHDGIVITELLNSDLALIADSQAAEIKRLQALIIRDKNGQIVTQGAFSVLVCQMEQLKKQLQSWKDGHAVQELRHKEEIERLKCIIRDVIKGNWSITDLQESIGDI